MFIPPEWLAKKSEVQKQWFRDEHEKQFGKPSTNDEELEKRLENVVDKFQKLSHRKVCERKYFYPEIVLPKLIEPITWNAPLSLKCVCPTGDCRCCCKGNTLLPSKRLPIVPPFDWWCLKVILAKLHIRKLPESSDAFQRKLIETVKKESEFYKSAQGRAILIERGPEFCLSGCLKFFITNLKQPKNFTAIINDMKEHVEPEVEKQEEIPEAPVVKKDLWTDRICGVYQCTVSTQSDTDCEGELMIGDYSHLMFGSPDDNILCDIDGWELQVSSYKKDPSDKGKLLIVKRTVDKLFRVSQIKQHISKVKQDLVTTIFEIPERFHSKESQYDAKEFTAQPSDRIYESLADVRRKMWEKKCLNKSMHRNLCGDDVQQDDKDQVLSGVDNNVQPNEEVAATNDSSPTDTIGLESKEKDTSRKDEPGDKNSNEDLELKLPQLNEMDSEIATLDTEPKSPKELENTAKSDQSPDELENKAAIFDTETSESKEESLNKAGSVHSEENKPVQPEQHVEKDAVELDPEQCCENGICKKNEQPTLDREPESPKELENTDKSDESPDELENKAAVFDTETSEPKEESLNKTGSVHSEENKLIQPEQNVEKYAVNPEQCCANGICKKNEPKLFFVTDIIKKHFAVSKTNLKKCKSIQPFPFWRKLHKKNRR